MPPHADDPGIGNDRFLLRVLRIKWITVKDNRERPTTESMTDSNYENSCFVDGEIPIEEIQRLFPGQRIARIPVHVIRGGGFIIERRPGEAPEHCSNPNAHVVVGPQREIRRNDY